MTTISRALQAADRLETELQVVCMVVCKRLFKGREADLLTVVLADEDGSLIETKTWKSRKAHAVYRKFQENQVVLVECPMYSIREPEDLNFSNAEFETYHWSLFHYQPFEFNVRSYFYCFTDIDEFHNNNRTAKMLAGLLVSKGRGPCKFGRSGEVLARGYFIKLKDANARIYRALVWEGLTDDDHPQYKFPLDSCRIGCCILLPFAREQRETYRAANPSLYTVTSSYPPVVNSACISSDVYEDLTNAPDDQYMRAYNPYGATADAKQEAMVVDEGDDDDEDRCIYISI